MSELRIAYLSNHFSGAVKLGFLADRGVCPTAVITLSPVDAARYQVAGYHDFRQDAVRLGIPHHQVRSFSLEHQDDLAFIRAQGCDLLLISGWQRLIPASILERFPLGAVAEHGSAEYLPRGRGRSPVAWTLIAGRSRFVVHLFAADAGADSGRIIDLEVVDLNPFDDIYTVYAKVGLASGRLLIRNLAAISAGTWQPRPPADLEPSYYPRRSEADDRIDWSAASTVEIHDKIRAITRPYPGAKALVGEEPLVIWKAQPFSYGCLDDFAAVPGQVLLRLPDGSLVVKTTDGSLLIRDYECPREVGQGERLR